MKIIDDFIEFKFGVAIFASGTVKVGLWRRFVLFIFLRGPVDDFLRGLFSEVYFLLSHFDDFILFKGNDFLEICDGFLKVLNSEFKEFVLILKLEFLLFFLTQQFLSVINL